MSDSVTYIGFVQDHSGSMGSLPFDGGKGNAELAVENFNEQRAKLLKEDDDTMDMLVSIVEFDDDIHCNIDNTPISEIKEMDKWWTGGMTALYDAIAYCIENIKKKMDNDQRKDKAVLIVVQTDGAENQSKKYNGEEGRLAINKMINELEDTKLWTFVFLGENIDKKVAMDMGFKMSNTMSHKSGARNVAAAYACSTEGLGNFVKSRKMGETQSMNFYDKSLEDNDNDNK
jgi:uncharacterized protein YegL